MGIIGFYAGSFDPFTNGHMQIVKKASTCFEKIIIGIGNNSEKIPNFNQLEMKKAIEKSIKLEKLDNVEVSIYYGLTVEAAQELGANLLIRGLRNGTDYQYEENIANMNEMVANIDTCYFRSGELGYLSSSMVMELYRFDREIAKYLPVPVAELLYREKKQEEN